jgi:hypothetical protein
MPEIKSLPVISTLAFLMIWDASTPDRIPRDRFLGFLDTRMSSRSIFLIVRSLYGLTLKCTVPVLLRYKRHTGEQFPSFESTTPWGYRFGGNPWISVQPVGNIRHQYFDPTEYIFWDTPAGYKRLTLTSDLEFVDKTTGTYRLKRSVQFNRAE